MSPRFFYLFVLICLTLSIVVSVTLVGHRAERSVFTLIEQANLSKAELTSNSLEQYLSARIAILNDLSTAPVLINSVLGAEYSKANLADYLDGYKILGQEERIVIYDFLGDSIYSNNDEVVDSVGSESWFLDLIDKREKVVVRTVESDIGSEFVIYMPIFYRNNPEGVLEVKFGQSLELLLLSDLGSVSAIEVNNSYFCYSSLHPDKNYTNILDSFVGSTGVEIRYFVDSETVKSKKFYFMLDIGLAILISFSISFFFLSVLGRKYILNPYLYLEKSRVEINIEKEKNDLLAQAIEESTVGISISTAEDGHPLSYVNKAFSRITGYCNDEVVGKNCRFLQGDNTSKEAVDNIASAIRRCEKVRVELINYKKDGTEFWNDLRLSPVFNSEGDLLAYVGVQQDITEEKSNQEILLKALDDAQAAVVAKSEFLANMSHEIRTPMNGVLGMLGLVLNAELDPTQKRRLEIAQNSATSLLTLINDILDFSKIEADKLDLEKVGFNVRSLIGEVGEVMALEAEGKKIELVLDLIGVDTPVVFGVPGRIRQVLKNLVVCASFKVSAIDGSVKLNCSVKDTGVGISEDKVESLFDAFKQVDASTTRKYGGTGLGLSIAKKLCEMMDGSIGVSSEPDKGSTFSFEVPVELSESSKISAPEVDMTKLNILIVDDNDVNREVLRGQLEHWGAKVFEASSGYEALVLCEQYCEEQSGRCFDIGFLDMKMPEMDGMELGKRILANKEFGGVRLVMMTSMGYRVDSKRFAEVGFSGYFPKPLTTSNLFDALNIIVDDGEVLDDAAPILTEHYLKYRHNPAANNSLENAKVLLVEDNNINRLVVEGILQDLVLSLDMAQNGQEALDAMLSCDPSDPYTLVIMDCQMPVMDGYDTTRAMRQGKAGLHYKDIPVIAITANAMDGDREVCINAGMSDYISKPIDSHQLINKLKQWNNIVDNAPEIDPELTLQEADVNTLIEPTVTDADLLMTESTIWNLSELLDRVGGSEDIARRLINIYLADYEDMFHAISLALESNDNESLKTCVHSLKGVVGNLGAVALVTVVREFEQAAKNETKDQYKILWTKTNKCNQELLGLFVQYVKRV
jgi:PAS domain S-box-containing protein